MSIIDWSWKYLSRSTTVPINEIALQVTITCRTWCSPTNLYLRCVGIDQEWWWHSWRWIGRDCWKNAWCYTSSCGIYCVHYEIVSCTRLWDCLSKLQRSRCGRSCSRVHWVCRKFVSYQVAGNRCASHCGSCHCKPTDCDRRWTLSQDLESTWWWGSNSRYNSRLARKRTCTNYVDCLNCHIIVDSCSSASNHKGERRSSHWLRVLEVTLSLGLPPHNVACNGSTHILSRSCPWHCDLRLRCLARNIDWCIRCVWYVRGNDCNRWRSWAVSYAV